MLPETNPAAVVGTVVVEGMKAVAGCSMVSGPADSNCLHSAGCKEASVVGTAARPPWCLGSGPAHPRDSAEALEVHTVVLGKVRFVAEVPAVHMDYCCRHKAEVSSSPSGP